MAVTFTNIVAGAAQLLIGDSAGTVADVGSTQDGASIAWEPTNVDIEVDQFGDAARVITEKIKVMVKTKLAEGTLQNLTYAWNYPTSTLVTVPTVTTTLSVGLQSVYPTERALRLIGSAPNSTSSVAKLRTYTCNRVMQYASSEHIMKRASNVAFPVDFRILPVPSQTGFEYGTIVDGL